MDMNKFKKLMLALALSVILVMFPFSGSEAQSAETPLSEWNCEKLQMLPVHHMDSKQRMFSGQCDAAEAGRAWEQSYGALDDGGLAAGVVYE
ncbi:hypothetical protein LVJ83_05025 [Uruburuella testudinis]|uniref:Secreted protein n=1 Tax=Uruburuella testudinis TaxID=1282863 RepID=A0ABY4DZ07_9NEIS|nr:hypothetical protein [Uruburuella testudinis]UOO82827.1 hypothetical protein LVJ83_05025 [Uruburuella testudinis]